MASCAIRSTRAHCCSSSAGRSSPGRSRSCSRLALAVLWAGKARVEETHLHRAYPGYAAYARAGSSAPRYQGCTEVTWPEPVERVAAFLRRSGAEARLEELPTDAPTAQAAADAVGCTLGQIVKSLVLVCDGTPPWLLVPGDRKADTGQGRAAAGRRRRDVARAEEVVEATGFAPGGVAPFPLERVPVVLVERTLLRHGVVWAGAGSDRHMVAIAPAELVRLTRGRLEDVVLESP